MSIIQFKKDTTVTEEIKEFSNRIENYETNLQSLSEEEKSSFKARRLVQGIYGQRQPDAQMIRIKVPGGHLSSKQFKQIADIAKNYSHGILHITTRQAIQLHYVKLNTVPKVVDKLAEVGLTSREACGNSVRNVSSSPYSGLLRDQVFDVTPAVEATANFFLRNPDAQNLPRKFKVAFSENNKDIGVTGLHDLGAIACEQNGALGFKVVVGGGLGSQPFPALVYNEFLKPDELLLHFLAIVRIFHRHGDRIKRMKARIKFLVHKTWGIEKFIEECAKEVEQIKTENINFPVINIKKDLVESYDTENPFNKDTETNLYMWYNKNILPTILKNQYMVLVQVPLGDLTPEQTYELCNFTTKFSPNLNEDSHIISVTDDQNFVLRHIEVPDTQRKEKFMEIYAFLESLDLAYIGAHDMSDPTSCPGTSTCNLGITHSKGLARAIRDRIGQRLVGNVKYEGATIHMSGCPNSCGRHHIATIGFFGRSEKITEDIQAPAYGVLIGGGNKGDGVIQVGKKCDKILAKRIPDFIETVMNYYEKNAKNNETFVDFCYNVSKEEILPLVQQFNQNEKAIQDTEKVNYDWGKDTPYVVEYGEGECAV